MKFINIKTSANASSVVEAIKSYEKVNAGVKFDEKKGRPAIKIKSFSEKGNCKKLALTCEMVGGATRDNGFLVGTYFRGKIVEQEGETIIKGIILTAPVYHLILALLTAFFIYRCISLRGINFVPILMIIFSFIMFKDEFKKQGIISRFLARASRYAEKAYNERM